MAAQVTHVGGGLVVALQDMAQLGVLAMVADQLGPMPLGAVVVDVSDLMMAPSDGVEVLVGRVRAAATACRPHRWSLVAARLTARRILRQLCADTNIGVYPSVDAALAAAPAGFRAADARAAQ
jgi:hypothetical protein